jgi:TatD DNase family protein
MRTVHDAHCHPFDLAQKVAEPPEAARLGFNVPCVASAWGKEDFVFNKALAENAKPSGVPVFLSFGVHPQLPAMNREAVAASFALFEALVQEGHLDAIGEIGFDLFDERYRATEQEQDTLFRDALVLAERYELPIILHIRKAMHKVFAYKNELRKLTAVVFHGFSGTEREAASLLAAGVNAFFSFGSAILNNHKKAERAVSLIQAERLLFETDSPYQPLRGHAYSHSRDLMSIVEKAASLRREAGSGYADAHALETLTDAQFYHIFGKKIGGKP